MYCTHCILSNMLTKKATTSWSDEHSIIHDKAFDEAKTQEDVLKADGTFINDQITHFIEDPIGSISGTNALLGAIGIGTKNVIEKKTGVIYPQVDSEYC